MQIQSCLAESILPCFLLVSMLRYCRTIQKASHTLLLFLTHFLFGIYILSIAFSNRSFWDRFYFWTFVWPRLLWDPLEIIAAINSYHHRIYSCTTLHHIFIHFLSKNFPDLSWNKCNYYFSNLLPFLLLCSGANVLLFVFLTSGQIYTLFFFCTRKRRLIDQSPSLLRTRLHFLSSVTIYFILGTNSRIEKPQVFSFVILFGWSKNFSSTKLDCVKVFYPLKANFDFLSSM